MNKPILETTGVDPDAPVVERAPDQLAKDMTAWTHTHDVLFRKRTWPVMSKTYMGMQLMFRADGLVEWIRHPIGGWALRGTWRSGVSTRSVIFGKNIHHEPDLCPALPEAKP